MSQKPSNTETQCICSIYQGNISIFSLAENEEQNGKRVRTSWNISESTLGGGSDPKSESDTAPQSVHEDELKNEFESEAQIGE